MKQLAVSIVIPLYNKEREVGRAIGSVLSQTFQDFEIVVVNDGSTDGGPNIVRKIGDPRIRIIDQENAGASSARNRGIIEAKSELIAFLDADDEWKPSFLETILNLKEKFPACKVFATNYVYCAVNGKYRLPIIRGLPFRPWRGIISDYFSVAAKSDPPLWTSAVAVTKEAIYSVGRFPIGVTSGEDLLMWARLAVHYNIAYSTEPEAIFRLRTGMADVPTRIPAEDDVVGKSLESLLPIVSPRDKKGFKQYIALWHRMRASMFLKLGRRQEAFWEVQKMEHFADKDVRFYTYAAMVHLPEGMTNRLMKLANLLRPFRRSFTF
jgi:glycosyltransferase involved in cell wall biosynthesis